MLLLQHGFSDSTVVRWSYLKNPDKPSVDQSASNCSENTHFEKCVAGSMRNGSEIGREKLTLIEIKWLETKIHVLHIFITSMDL